MAQFSPLLALVHSVQPSANAGTFASCCKGACIASRIVFEQGDLPAQKQSKEAAAHIEGGKNKEK